MNHGPEPNNTLQQVVDRFSSAWQRALHDHDSLPPRIDDFLVPGHDQASLRQALETIDRSFRGTPPTIQDQGDGDVSPSAKTDELPSGGQGQGPEHTGSSDKPDDSPDAMASSATEQRILLDAPQVRGYEILEELGRSSVSVVYRARRCGKDRNVALKMILPGQHATAERLDLIEAEAEAVARLRHANIARIYDVGRHDGSPYFSLELVDGESLEHIAHIKPLVPTHAAELVGKLAQAIHYAHQRGVIHRDLKPANVLLTNRGVPKITNFGLLTRVEDDSGTSPTGAPTGTPSFMAPEQARSRTDAGPPADIYALGAILYTLLTGRPPFLAATVMDTITQLVNDEPVPPSKLQPTLPRDIETICLKCLNKAPERRYETAAALADDLSRFCQGRAILARPVGIFERAWRWCRRNPAAAVPAAAAALLAMAIIIGGPLAATLIHGQKEEALAAQAFAERKEQIAARRAEVANQQTGIVKEQRTRALQTLDGVVTEIEQQLRNHSELDELRQSILQETLDGLEAISRIDGNADVADLSLGTAHRHMGEFLARAGRNQEALTQLRKGLVNFDKLMEQSNNSDLARWNAAVTHDDIGAVKNNMLEDARTIQGHFQHALLHREILASRGEELNPKLRPEMIEAALVESHTRLGNLALQAFCAPRSAIGSFERAASHGEALIAGAPDQALAKQSLAAVWHGLAQALYRLGQDDQADKMVSKSMNLRQALLADNPQSFSGRQDVAASNSLRGDVLLRAKQYEQALNAYESAHGVLVALFEDDPKNPGLQRDVAESYYRLGTAYRGLNRQPEARAAFTECLALYDKMLEADPGNPGTQLRLALAQARCGEIQEAAKVADELRPTLAPNPGTLFCLARIYALCLLSLQDEDAATGAEADQQPAASTERYLNSALQSLQEAIKNGFRDPYELRYHPDLDAVRNSAEFDALLEVIREST